MARKRIQSHVSWPIACCIVRSSKGNRISRRYKSKFILEVVHAIMEAGKLKICKSGSAGGIHEKVPHGAVQVWRLPAAEFPLLWKVNLLFNPGLQLIMWGPPDRVEQSALLEVHWLKYQLLKKLPETSTIMSDYLFWHHSPAKVT